MFKEKLKLVPNTPGIYMMLDKFDNIIYIGKAKNLKNRVKSYFQGAHNLKTTKLITEIESFSYVQTKTEREALILEHNLIKEHLPKYNIRLTDDKSYPYILITNETHPKIIVSRTLKKGAGTYFGPYPNAYAAKETVRLLNRIYPFRKCDTIPKQACLYYHIGQCLAPCINKEPIDYEPYIKEITTFLKGDDRHIRNYLESQMHAYSESLQFEQALEYKNLLQMIDTTTSKQVISLNDFKDRDFIAYESNEEDISLHILKMRQGKIIDSKSDIFPLYIDTEQVLSYLYDYYQSIPIPDELCFSDKFDLETIKSIFGNKAFIPKRGKKKDLVLMAYKNASYDLEHERMLHMTKVEKHNEALESFKETFALDGIKRIDLFDNSHTFGSQMIGVMVVYKDFKPAKKEYRKYILKHTNKADDIGAFKEVIYRRYYRVLLEKLELPELIIVDGGEAQVDITKETLSSLGLILPVMGLKKDSKHTLKSVIYEKEEYPLNTHKTLYTLLSNMIEETHRFAISFHRSKRSKVLFSSRLDHIKGVGPATKKKLLTQFGSIEAMIGGTAEEYAKIGIHENLRKRIIDALVSQNESNHI